MSEEQPPGPGEQPGYQPYTPPPAYGPPQPPTYGYGYGPPALPDHPRASTALVLGLVALAGGFFCALPLVVGPFAWASGASVRKEIDSNPIYGGRDKATAGMVMGMVATGLLALALLVVVAAVVIVVAAGA